MSRINKGIIIFFILSAASSGWAEESVLIFAGAGMRGPLDEIGKAFKTDYGIPVVYDYEGSGRLGNKILTGQTPDIFIPGSEKWAQLLQEKGYVERCFPIACHIPVIITPMESTKIQTLEDLSRSDLRLVLGDEKAAAIGRTTNIVLEKSGIERSNLNVVARGITVKQLVRWIEMNTADVSIVWRADAIQSGKVRIVPISEEMYQIVAIPVCEMNSPPHPKAAEIFLEYLVTYGKEAFKKHGFIIKN